MFSLILTSKNDLSSVFFGGPGAGEAGVTDITSAKSIKTTLKYLNFFYLYKKEIFFKTWIMTELNHTWPFLDVMPFFHTFILSISRLLILASRMQKISEFLPVIF